MRLLDGLRRSFRGWTAEPPRGVDLLWSKGIAAHCDVRGPDDYAAAPTESLQQETFFAEHFRRAKGLVWLRLSTRARLGLPSDLDLFARFALPTVRKPFALVTTDGDASVPSELPADTVSALLESPHLVAWRSQNYDGTPHPKLGPIPIGLDLHTPYPEGSADSLAALITRIRREREAIRRQPLGIFTDINLNLNSTARREVLARLAGCPHVAFAESRVSQEATWRRYAGAPFVLSVAGNGTDCHRTWEALYLGSIVITRRSALDPLFAGLPVAIIDDWSEVADAARLTAWRDRLAPFTGQAYIRDRLAPDRWLRPLRDAVAAARERRTPRRKRRH